MYTWRKRVTADWLRPRNEELERRFGGALAIVERAEKIRILLQISCSNREQACELREQFGGQIEKLPADWFRQMVKQARSKPLRIGSRLTVTHAAESNPKHKSTIVVPAEAAFGTGDHATTAMCLRILERVTRKIPEDWSMLDAGTGTGILAIAASRFGAKTVLAIDNDPSAIATATRNAKANHARDIQFRTGDILRQNFGTKFDIIAANLYSEILIRALHTWRRHLVPDGRLVLSGILRSQEKAVLAGLRQNGFAKREVRRRGKWIAVLAWRAPKKS
jgi:ribosomal protein L11 methyltransferase